MLSSSPMHKTVFSLAGVCLLLVTGCASNQQAQDQLEAGNKALAASDYDSAIRDADNVLSTGSSDYAAAADYLRGLAIINRMDVQKPDAVTAQRELEIARGAFIAGLAQPCSPELAARLHAQLGFVEYFQDEYAPALRDLSAALPGLKQPAWKQYVLYRMGVCQQRLGRFEDADATFLRVQTEYPGTEIAHRAQARHGVRGFYVQIGVFSQQSDIDKAARTIDDVGSVALRTQDKGMTVLRTADVPSFEQAAQLKSRLAYAYPDALVMP
jgi:tetratricopeptide (TPR) repeat protein